MAWLGRIGKAVASPKRRELLDLGDYCAMVDAFYRGGRNVLIVKEDEWGGLKGNGALMMILAYLLGTSLPWRQAEVRVGRRRSARCWCRGT